jgi:predicted TIM-barrel fold metal-dependent hydrolase
MIVDGHAHITSAAYGSADVLLAQLDQAGIDRCLCVPGGMLDVRQFDLVLTGRVVPDPRIPNPLVYEALQRHGSRLYGLVCLNPHDGAAAIGMMEDGFRHCCRGVKLAPMVHRFRFDLPVVKEVAAACGERGFPVYSHVVPAPGATTEDFAALARSCPQTAFILGHMGFGPYDSTAIARAAVLPNLYLETSLGNYLALHDALETLGPNKLVFGSEFPLGHPRAELENVRLLSDSAHAAILGTNILRLLNLAG